MFYATSERAADETLVSDVAETLGLESAAVFDLEPALGGYMREVEVGWGEGHARSIPCDDHLALMLGSKHNSCDWMTCEGIARMCRPKPPPPLLAFPLNFRPNFRCEIRGFVVFGALTNGTSIGPDELKRLEHLVKNAGTRTGSLRTTKRACGPLNSRRYDA